MATLANAPDLKISVTEYLKGDFRPDVDFVDGRIEERNVGELDHSRWQLALMLWFAQHKAEWGLQALPELRLQIDDRRYRVPDVCVFRRDQQLSRPVPSIAPLAVFEVLSPEDRFSRMLVRVNDFARMGVPNIFVLAEDEVFYRVRNGAFERIEEETSALEGSEAYVDWKQLGALRF